MKQLSRSDLESIAIRVWEAYKLLQIHEGKEIEYVDPDILLVNLLGLNVSYHHLSVVGDVFGATTRGDGVGARIFDDPEKIQFYYLDGRTVLIERDLVLNARFHTKCNFTKAHEAGHQILHMLYPDEYGEIESDNRVYFYKERQTNADWEEWQANTLAAAMLLPQELIMRYMSALEMPEHIPVLNKVYYSETYEKFSLMAKKMQVSKRTLSIRLQQLGIVDREYISNPYSFLDID